MKSKAAQVVLLGVVTLLCGWASLRFPFGPDQGVFAQVGRTILEGGLPIRDAFDVKPPGVYLAYALAESVFGPHEWSVRALDLIVVFLTSVNLYFFLGKANKNSGLFAGLIYPFLYFLCFGFSETAQTEGFANLFLSAGFALICCSDRSKSSWFLLAGVAFSLAVLMKTSNVLFLIPALIYVHRETAHSKWRVMVGFAIPFVLMTGWFAAKGSIGTVVEMYVFQSQYGSKDLSSVGEFARNFWRYYCVQFPGLFTGVILTTMLMLLPSWSSEHPGRVVRSWFLWSMIIALLQMRFYPYHFVILVPPMSCVLGGYLATWRPIKYAWSGVACVLGILAGMLMLNMRHVEQTVKLAIGQIDAAEYGSTVSHAEWYVVEDTRSVVDWLRKNGHSGKSAYVDAFDPAIYWLADLRAVSRHISTAPIYNELQISAELRFGWLHEMRRDLERDPPQIYIQHPMPDFEIDADYELGFASGHYEVYIRKEP